jgi:glycerol dehydrogenase-like iron-containing ADH family enzyme
MTPRKQRLTVTVDPELVEAGNRAVASGAADSLSAWVSRALSDKAEKDQRLEHLRDAIADYEAEFGEITADEITAQRRADREGAVVVRGRRTGAGPGTGRRHKAKSG